MKHYFGEEELEEMPRLADAVVIASLEDGHTPTHPWFLTESGLVKIEFQFFLALK